MEIRLVSQDGKRKGIAYIEFKSEADAEKAWKKSWGQKLMDDLFHSTILERKDKGKRELKRIALGVVKRKFGFK
jgi:RNA recognition motif-containing protein